MANGLIRGLIAKNTGPENIWASDPDESKLQLLAQDCAIHTGSNTDIARNASVIILAVKPQVMRDACKALAADIGQRKVLLVSIAAGITTSHLESWFGESAAIVRCMPNTPALVGMGASGLFANAKVTKEQKQLAQEVISTVGFATWVDADSDIDIVTAISGSGPAYFFLFMEAMIDAAGELGLDRETATLMTQQTALGAARMAIESDVDLKELRRRVTSPAGTTEAAIQSFEHENLRSLVQQAMEAAQARAVEMAREMG